MAVLLAVPVDCGRPLIWIVGARRRCRPCLIGHVTMPLVWEHVPCDGTAESKVIPAGNVSVTTSRWQPGPGVADRQGVGDLLADQHRVGESVFVIDRLAFCAGALYVIGSNVRPRLVGGRDRHRCAADAHEQEVVHAVLPIGIGAEPQALPTFELVGPPDPVGVRGAAAGAVPIDSRFARRRRR